MTRPSEDRIDRGPAPGTIAALGSVVVLSTVFLAWAVPLTPGRLEHPAAALIPRVPFWAFLAAHRPPFLDQPAVFAPLLLLACAAGFAACAIAVRRLWNAGDRRDLTTWVLGFSALGLLATWAAPPNLNSNLWNYMLRGRVAAAHGANPYLTAADEFPDDPLYPYANHAYTGTPGGKLAAWMVVNVAFARLGADDPVRTLFVYRSGLLLFSIATMLVLAAASRRAVPTRAAAGLALWGWSPVVLMNSLARTDIVMLFWLVLGCLLLVRGRRRTAVVPLVLSVYVKLVTGPLLAVAALSELRQRRFRELAVGMLLVAATTVVIWAPFYAGNAGDLVAGYVSVTTSAEGSARGPLKGLLAGGFLVLLLAVGLTRKDTSRSLLEGWVYVQIYFSLFLAKFASADYLMPLIALVALTMGARAVVAVFALGLSYFLFDQWYLVGARNFPMPDLFPFPRTVVFFLPPVAAAAYFLGRIALRRARKPALP